MCRTTTDPGQTSVEMVVGDREQFEPLLIYRYDLLRIDIRSTSVPVSVEQLISLLIGKGSLPRDLESYILRSTYILGIPSTRVPGWVYQSRV